MNISLLLNSDSTSIEVIKYCALYFDKITIDKSIHIYTIEKLEKTKSKHKPIKCNLHFLQLYDLDLDKHIKMLENEGIALTNKKYVEVDEDGKTSYKKVFAGGDVTGQNSTVAWAARDGREIANKIAEYLNAQQ